MSEIWTPGSPTPSQSSGGIELPKGFSTSRREDENQPETDAEASPPTEQPSTSENEATAPQPQSAAAGDPRQQPELNLLFPRPAPKLRAPAAVRPILWLCFQ